MKFLDKIALNRMIAIITSFILGVLKLFKGSMTTDDTTPTPPKIPLFKRRKKKQ
jgi:hypothetical protein